MNWILLVIAGIFEVAFAACLGKTKSASGSEYWMWMAGFIICLTVSMVLLMKVVQYIPIGTAYAVWTGIGATGTVIVSVVWFKEPFDFWRIFFLATLIMSIIGLKLIPVK